MTDICIMVEGQEDMTWERFFRIAHTVEDLGFDALFRSDHLTALNGDSRRESLALWPSLTALALRTNRIRFGPMVCSMTFRHPAMVAKMAAAVDQLSGGRLDLGLGAGWFEGEHRMFGIKYPPYSTRLRILDEGAQVIKSLWSGKPFTYQGEFYQLKTAESHPQPAQNEPVIIMGGKGHKTLKIVAKHASEWNCSYVGLDVFREKSAELDEDCRQIGRDPASLRRSLMIPFIIGKDSQSIQEKIDGHRSTFPHLPATHEEWLAAGFLGGHPGEMMAQMNDFVEAGIQRFMLQHNDLDDLASLELLAAEVLPHMH
jgi:F420-dependent oxidoreductase-like protein